MDQWKKRKSHINVFDCFSELVLTIYHKMNDYFCLICLTLGSSKRVELMQDKLCPIGDNNFRICKPEVQARSTEQEVKQLRFDNLFYDGKLNNRELTQTTVLLLSAVKALEWD